MNACTMPQCMVDQRPTYDNKRKKKVHRPNQVVGKAGVIRPDKRTKNKYY